MLIFPGSRSNEVSRLLTPFIGAAKILQKKDPSWQFAIPTVDTVEDTVRRIVRKHGFTAKIFTGSEMRYAAMSLADGAIAASGTVSLELAKFNVPHLVAYKFALLSYFMAKLLIGKRINMNILNRLLGKTFIPELLQGEVTPENIAATFAQISRRAFAKDAARSLDLLRAGKHLPSHNAALRVLSYVKKYK
jgi:lipid-A-disaccharide synthase